MLRPRLPRIALSLRRSLHQVPPLTHDFRNGVPGLLSPTGFDVAWTQYQSLMVEKLNGQTANDEQDASMPPKELLLKYARDPNFASLFNHASMAHNNNFFFQGLSPEPTTMPDALKKELEDSFSSIDTLKKEFIVTASSMFGPGFVWLVKSQSNGYSLLVTYLAGSPYPGAHFRRQTKDLNTENDQTVSDYGKRLASEREPVNTVGAHGPHSEKKTPLAPGGIELNPILCINMWEHVYLPDYGVGAFGVGGKRAFAESWWHAIDWNVVANRADVKSGRKFKT